MVKLEEELWNTLQELKEEEFRGFKWFLKQDDILEGFSGIPEARLEKAERLDTVDLMVQKYPGPEALKVTLKVLEKISRNDLVQRLDKSCSRPKDLKNRDCVPLKRDYERNKAELAAKIELMIQERRMKIGELRHAAELSSKSADRHVADSERVFAALLQSVERSRADLIEAINEKRATTRKRAEEFIQELEQEMSELRKRSNKMEQLSCAKDRLHDIPPTKNWTDVSLPPPSYGGSVGAAVDQLQEELRKEREKLIAKAKLYRVQQFAKDVTLDPDTANPYLVLSDDGKQVHCGDVKQNLPDNPERFDPATNVLGKQSFSSGRFYYEVRVEGKTSWDLGVVKGSTYRKGSIKASPENGYWTICLRNGDKYRASAVHLSVRCQPKKVGVFVDYENGLVSFLDVDSAVLIHRFTDCSFAEKLYPFFSPSLHNAGKNSTPLIISPVSYAD